MDIVPEMTLVVAAFPASRVGSGRDRGPRPVGLPGQGAICSLPSPQLGLTVPIFLRDLMRARPLPCFHTWVMG